MTEVAILSIFGRGNWIANELAERGFRVALVDLSSQFGPWAPEDCEGPFGFFQSDGILPSQLERLTLEDAHEALPNGFCLLLEDGPLDMAGPLSSFWLERKGFDDEILNYLRRYDRLSQDELSKIRYRLDRKEYSQTWLTALAHQLACPVYLPNALARRAGRPVNLLAPYFTRRVSRRGFENLLQATEKKGVKVYKNASLIDVQVSSDKMDSVEIKSEWSGALQADNFVWCFTSEETEFLGERVVRPLFPKGAERPQWAWVRYQIQFNNNRVTEVLPAKIFCISDLSLPWTHTNLVVLQRSQKVEVWDVWIRIPQSQRFKTDYLQAQAENIVRLLELRLPATEPRIHQMPQDFIYDSGRLGPTRWPVYDAESKRLGKGARLHNWFLDSPETWGAMDWTGIFHKQADLVKVIEKRVLEARVRLEKKNQKRPELQA